MAEENAVDQQKRLTVLENRLKALEAALMAEKRKTAAMQELLTSQQSGVDNALASYDRAFSQAAKSYEPIIQRALTLSAITKITEKETDGDGGFELEIPKSVMDNVSSVFKDLPRTLAAMALVISLFTGGTSVVSLFQSNLAQSQVEEVSDQVKEAKEDSDSAKQEASNAKIEAVEAKKEAESAKENASEAKQEAKTANDNAEKAKIEVEKVRQTTNPGQ